MPLVPCLLQSIECSVQLEYKTCSKPILESLRSLHEHLMIEFPIQKCVADVQREQFQVLDCRKRKNCSQSSPSCSGSKDLSKIKSRALREAFCNQPGFVSVNRSIWLALELENPSATNCIPPCRQLNWHECAILQKRIELLKCSSMPQMRIWTPCNVLPVRGL